MAKKAGVTANTVSRIELGADAKQSTIEAIQHALEAAGIEFIPENGGGPGARVRKAVAPTVAPPARASKRAAGTKTARRKKARQQRS